MKNEYKSKIEFFAKKHMIKLNKDSMKKPEKLQELLDFLLLIDQQLPYEDFFTTHGKEWFNVVFKLIFYSNKYAVVNNEKEGYLKLEILPYENIAQIMTQDLKIEDKINFVVNNLLNKMLIKFDKQELLVQVAELLFSQDKVISIKKIAKLLIYFGKLFELTPHKRCKFLQGSLFALGALMKIEAKSYLKTKSESIDNFKFVCPLINQENDLEKQEEQRLRIMSSEDIDYFETDFVDIVLEFIKSIVNPIRGIIKQDIFNYYIDFSNPNFIDEYEEEEQKNPDKLYALESAHYTLCFLFDLMQFSFQYLVIAQEEQNQQQTQQQQDPRQNIFDHRKPITVNDLICLHFTYYIKRFEEIISEVVNSIQVISPNTLNLLWFWHIKNSDEPKKWDQIEEGKEAYERTDNYNVIGFSAYLFLHFLEPITHLSQNQSSKEMNFYKSSEYFLPYNHDFILESLLPFFNYSYRSKSSTLRQLSLSTLGFWVYQTQGKEHYQDLGHYTKDDQVPQYLVQTLFNNMGSQDISLQQQRLSMKILKQFLDMYAPQPRVTIFNYLYQILDDDKNDRAISILTSQFYKQECDRSPQEFISNAKEVFSQTLDSLKDENTYILDVTERIQASLNLYIYLVQKEKFLINEGLLQQPIISEQNYKNDVKKKYFDPMSHTINAGLTNIEEELKKVEQEKEENVKKGMKQSIMQRKYSLEIMQTLLSQANSH